MIKHLLCWWWAVVSDVQGAIGDVKANSVVARRTCASPMTGNNAFTREDEPNQVDSIPFVARLTYDKARRRCKRPMLAAQDTVCGQPRRTSMLLDQDTPANILK